jgi:hypothetical protein
LTEEPDVPLSSITQFNKPAVREMKGSVHCPLCTHTVPATIIANSRGTRVMPGQKCPRCSSSLDAGYVLRIDRAA